MNWVWMLALSMSSACAVYCAWLIACELPTTMGRAKIWAALLGAIVAPYGYVFTHPKPADLRKQALDQYEQYRNQIERIKKRNATTAL